MESSDPDVRLMLAFRAGDETALPALYRRWAGPLLHFLSRMVRENAMAEDLMQETFVRVHGARDRYSPEARFSTWLFRIARNLALNELERTRNRAPHLSKDAEDRSLDRETGEASARPALTLVAPESSVEVLVDAKREHAKLERALENLPERQRSALWLAAAEGYSYQEIAEILETSAASVKALVHRARVGLADQLEDAASQTASETDERKRAEKRREKGPEKNEEANV